MKFTVYNKKVEEVVRLKLVETEDRVRLIAVDVDGVVVPGGSILSIRENGVHLYPGISDKLGIKMDAAGFIRVVLVV